METVMLRGTSGNFRLALYDGDERIIEIEQASPVKNDTLFYLDGVNVEPGSVWVPLVVTRWFLTLASLVSVQSSLEEAVDTRNAFCCKTMHDLWYEMRGYR